MKYRQRPNKLHLLLVSFNEQLFDFMVDQLLSKKTEILPLATSHIRQSPFMQLIITDHVYALLISMPCSESRPRILNFVKVQ